MRCLFAAPQATSLSAGVQNMATPSNYTVLALSTFETVGYTDDTSFHDTESGIVEQNGVAASTLGIYAVPIHNDDDNDNHA